MSWSYSIPHCDKAEAITRVKAANRDQIPASLSVQIVNELNGLPDGSRVTISTYGHLGWGEGQTGGQISSHFTIDVQAPPPDVDPT